MKTLYYDRKMNPPKNQPPYSMCFNCGKAVKRPEYLLVKEDAHEGGGIRAPFCKHCYEEAVAYSEK